MLYVRVFSDGDKVMAEETDKGVAERYCAAQGAGWTVEHELGRGGTARVFRLNSPNGARAFKIFSKDLSDGARGKESERRIKTQIELGQHECPNLIKTFDGGIL